MLSIGALSKRTGVKVPTIRYYEQVGLLPEPERSEGNQRRYGGRAVDRLGFIRHARDLGFSIQAIQELIYLSEHPHLPCIDATRIAGEQLVAVRNRIAKLKRLEAELDQIASDCTARSAADCYVLKALSEHPFLEN